MALIIEDAETSRIVHELAERTGRNVADAVKAAAERELAMLPQPRGGIDVEKLEALLAAIRPLRVHDPRSDDEIIGYDENGLPT